MKSQLYAHRSIPSLMVQELIYDNPTVSMFFIREIAIFVLQEYFFILFLASPH